MIKSVVCFTLLLCLSIDTISAQDTSFVATQSLTSGYITAGALMTSGIILNRDATKNDVREWVRDRYDVPQTNIDDILQHAPIGMVYLMDWSVGSKKEKVAMHTRHMLVTQGLTLVTVRLAKEIFNVRRPRGGSLAFPSGHTSYAFASAGVFYQSFKEDHPILAYSGYLPAIIVGAYRMIKDEHWISDVLVGAGTGILFSHLSYHLNIWDSRTVREKGRKHAQLSIGLTNSGVGLAVNF